MYSRISAIFADFQPITRTELSPEPIPSTKRPPVSSSTAAAADAVTVTWRVTGLLTLVPSTIRDVARPMAPMVTHTSRHSSWESGTHA
jgi:hypothetical protein